MGEVYRAKDSRLGRDVAVKVLPQHLSANSEIRVRFEREAKTVSSLNHPNICTLFDVGRAPGEPGAPETDFLVMELIEGETLAQRLQKGALPPADVLKFGAQIADALDRAHRAGVIHRDLKPGNVMLTRSGAKLMDFGLARATGLAPVTASGSAMTVLAQSPTIASPLTAEGTIVGTFQYMSPEQLEGKEADARSDLWSLGCVLYEMATGRRAFEGASQASLIGAILHTEPPAIGALAPLAPPGLDRLVRTCLTKDSEERAQTAHDVKLQLQGLAEPGSQSGAAPPVPHARRNGARLPWIVAALATVAALVAGAFALLAVRAPHREPVQLSLDPPVLGQFSPYSCGSAISPDGRSVACSVQDSSGAIGLYLRSLAAAEPVLLVPGCTPLEIFWSPDSRTIGFIDAVENKMKTVPITGGTPVTIATLSSVRGAAWNGHGEILYAPAAQGPLYRIPAGGGTPVPVTALDASRHESAHRFPCFLPDDEHFVYAALPAGPEGFDIRVGSLRSKESRHVLFASSSATYAAPGYLVFTRAGKIVAQAFDAGSFALRGDAVAIADAPKRSDLDGDIAATTSRDGRLLFRSEPEPETHLEWIDRGGHTLGTLPLPAGHWGRPVLSPDDRYAVAPNGDDLWRIDLARAVAARLTSNGAVNSDPVWSPDGARIAFTVRQQGREEIAVMNSDGSGEPRTLTTTGNLFKNADDWNRSGLIFNDIAGSTFRDMWIMAPDATGPARTLLRTPFAEYAAKVSPDGRWLAYLSSEAGNDDVYIQSFPALGHKVRVSTEGARRLWWGPGSDEVMFRAFSNNDLMSAKLTRQGDDLVAATPTRLFRDGPGAVGGDLTHDGRRELLATATEGTNPRKLRVVLDWTGLLRR